MHVDPATQVPDPVHDIPPHCPHFGIVTPPAADVVLVTANVELVFSVVAVIELGAELEVGVSLLGNREPVMPNQSKTADSWTGTVWPTPTALYATYLQVEQSANVCCFGEKISR